MADKLKNLVSYKKLIITMIIAIIIFVLIILLFISLHDKSKNQNNDYYEFTLSKDTMNFISGDWTVGELYGFTDPNGYAIRTNDKSKVPSGQEVQDIQGDKIIIEPNYFSSKGLTNYPIYQYEIKKPIYEQVTNNGGTEFVMRSLPGDFTSQDKIIEISTSYKSNSNEYVVPINLWDINNNKLILSIDGTYFELKKD